MDLMNWIVSVVLFDKIFKSIISIILSIATLYKFTIYILLICEWHVFGLRWNGFILLKKYNTCWNIVNNIWIDKHNYNIVYSEQIIKWNSIT